MCGIETETCIEGRSMTMSSGGVPRAVGTRARQQRGRRAAARSWILQHGGGGWPRLGRSRVPSHGDTGEGDEEAWESHRDGAP
jgi:hypothetical protein